MGLKEIRDAAETFDREAEQRGNNENTGSVATDQGTPPVVEEEAPAVTETAPVEVPVATDTATPPVVESELDYKAEYERLKPEYDRLLHAHSVLQGKTYAEVPRLHAENKELKGSITAKDTEIAELKARIGNAQTAQGKQADADEEAEALENLIDEYGEDSNVVKAHKASMAANKKLLAQLAEAKKQPEAAAPEAKVPEPAQPHVVEDNPFVMAVSMAVPDWYILNGNADLNIPPDPKFLAFLDTTNPNAAGLTYRQLAEIHSKNGNAEGFADVFREFKKTGKTATAAPPVKTNPLEELIEPSTKSGGSKPSENKKTYSQAEIQADYQRYGASLAKGAPIYTEAEWVAREAEYDAATAEGRVVQ